MTQNRVGSTNLGMQVGCCEYSIGDVVVWRVGFVVAIDVAELVLLCGAKKKEDELCYG